ncbi:MAG: Holliday junction resolvase [Candidatus Thermoplasmatota archaeon]
MSSVYERELKGILSGDEKFLESLTANFNNELKEMFYRVLKKPFVVVRAAGSFGIDIVALRGDVSLLMEVKTSSKRIFHFSNEKRLILQIEKLKEECEETGLIPIYAYRLKNFRDGDPWRIFTLPLNTKKIQGILRIVYNRVPKIGETAKGNYVMRWEEGMELAKLIEYLCYDVNIAKRAVE